VYDHADGTRRARKNKDAKRITKGDHPMLLLIILLVLLFGGGGGYYGYSRWGAGGGFGILGTVLLIVLVVYLLGGIR
jgi:polyferredoxin